MASSHLDANGVKPNQLCRKACCAPVSLNYKSLCFCPALDVSKTACLLGLYNLPVSFHRETPSVRLDTQPNIDVISL